MSVVTTASSFALGGTKIERLCISWESRCWQWAPLILDDHDELSEFFALGAVPLLSYCLQNNERSYDNAKAARCRQIWQCIILCYDSCMAWSVEHCFRVHASAIVHVHNIWFTADSCTAVWSCKKSFCDMLWILWQQRNLRRLCTQLICSTLRG